MKYRPEIDGLRAIAVLPVILFHAGSQVFRGGFVGVDVFFVISGFLITTILIDDLERGDFSILGFYERRARRILPALFFVMLCSLPFAWLWMFPDQLKGFSQSLVAVSLFASNILFWRKIDYFWASADEVPLLHTWSLAVEEQYYILFPIFLVLVWRFGKNRVFWSIVILAAISLALSEWGGQISSQANFYLAPTRAWELLAGSIAAFTVQKRGVRKSEVLSLLGLGAIVFSIFVYDRYTPFPGVYTLVPVGGAVLVILFADSKTMVAKLLSTKAFVGLGLISYSAYLWQQPLFAFAHIRSVNAPDSALMAGLAVLSLLLAVLSWKYVEQPFRSGKTTIIKARSTVFAMSLVGLLAFTAIGLWGHAQQGFAWRLSAQTLQVLSSKGDRSADECLFSAEARYSVPLARCQHAVPAANGTVLLLGDSHSSAISPTLILLINNDSRSVYEASYAGCIPVAGFRVFNAGDANKCAAFVSDSLNYARENGVDTIVLSARFPFYYWGALFDNFEGGVEGGRPIFVDDLSLARSRWDSEDRRARVLALMGQRIVELSQEFNVVLVAPVPEMGWDVVTTTAKRAMLNGGRVSDLSVSYDSYQQRAGVILDLFSRLEADLDTVRVARIQDDLCNPISERCFGVLDGEILYFDDDHLSNEGARRVAPTIMRAINAFYQE